jgi:hypothetical protein
MITIREISYNGQTITVTANERGTVFVNGREAGIAKVDGQSFIWGSVKDGLPANTKIGLTSAHLFAIEQHSANYRAAMAARNAKARAYDATHNEGGYGYNPHA